MQFNNSKERNPTGLPDSIFHRLAKCRGFYLKGTVVAKEELGQYFTRKSRHVEYWSNFEITFSYETQFLECSFSKTPTPNPKVPSSWKSKASYDFTLSRFRQDCYIPTPVYGDSMVNELAILLWGRHCERKRLLKLTEIVGTEAIGNTDCYKITFGRYETNRSYIWLQVDTLTPVKITETIIKKYHECKNSLCTKILEAPPFSLILFLALILHDTIICFFDRRDLMLLYDGYRHLDVEYNFSNAILKEPNSIEGNTETESAGC